MGKKRTEIERDIEPKVDYTPHVKPLQSEEWERVRDGLEESIVSTLRGLEVGTALLILENAKDLVMNSAFVTTTSLANRHETLALRQLHESLEVEND